MSQRIEAARLVRKHEAARALIVEADRDRAAVKDDSMNPQPNLEAWYLRLLRADHSLTMARGALAEARGDAVLLMCQSGDDAAIDAAHAFMDAGNKLEFELQRLARPAEDPDRVESDHILEQELLGTDTRDQEGRD